MKNLCKTVTLRKRIIKDGTMQSYYLDYYPGYRDGESMKVLRHESIGIYIYTNPKNEREKAYNARMREMAEAIRCRRYESIVKDNYDFFDKERLKGDFLAYFRKVAKKSSKCQNVYLHFEKFVGGKCTFEEITVDLCSQFREYLLNAKQTLYDHLPLHINTAANYWSSFRAVLHTAYRDRKIKENPNGFLERIDCIPTNRENLSQAEVIALANTPCDKPMVKKAFLFSCLTALRKSDIIKLTWEEIQPYGEGTMFVTTRMQKTKDIVHVPIGKEALELIDYTPEKKGLVFPNVSRYLKGNTLKNWLSSAGITFHCARHTWATLQLYSGTHLKIVQECLGHKNVSTTEIYAKTVDEQKKAVVDRIRLNKCFPNFPVEFPIFQWNFQFIIGIPPENVVNLPME